MKKTLLAATSLTALIGAGAARADCGDVSLAVFSWQSAEAQSYVDQFILNAGYGCTATTVAGDTVPTITSMIEKGQPDVAPDAAPSLLGEFYAKGVDEGRIKKIGVSISDGSVSGWYIPAYVAEAHPEIRTVADALAHPELFPSPENPARGGVIQGPQGWGDTVVAAQLFKAMQADTLGFDLVPTGSGAALDGAIAKAYERKEGFIATYWAPTSLLVQYPMLRLEAPHDPAEWVRCTTVQDCPDPAPNYWKQTDEVVLASADFAANADPAVLAYLGQRSWTQAEVGQVMMWMTENQANGEDAAKWFIQNMPELWTKWVPADVAEKVKAAAE